MFTPHEIVRITVALLASGLALAIGPGAWAAAPAEAGPVEIAKWKDGKAGAFMLEFDDSAPSQVKNVVPELKKRGLIGTFYINPGAGHYNKQAWEQEIPAMGMEYGNHTFTHKGVRDAANADEELARCNEVIARCFPDRKIPRLISFGRPGGVPWNITPEEQKALLAKYNLIDRPPFWGAAIHLKTAEDMMRLVDKAVEKGTVEHIDFHGVGGDWLSASMPDFLALLDKLDACRDRLWITDPVSYHKYMTERDGAELKVLESGPQKIRLTLACKADPKLYDLPLTLIARVPADWKQCQVSQGKTQSTVTAAGGAITFPALPGAEEIVIQPAAK